MSTFFEVLFALAIANLRDDGVLVLTHAAYPEVSRSIHNWVHTEEFDVTEDRFDMNDLNLQSPINTSELVIHFWPHMVLFLPSFSHFFLSILPMTLRVDSQDLHQGVCT